MNAEPASLSFAIDIRQYVAVSALEVASLQLERRGLSFKDSGLKDTDAKRVDRRVLTWSTIIDNEGDAEKQLAYFEAVASLFDSKHSADQDPVNRGLRLVIQMIVQSGELKQKENLIVLPTSQAQFLAGIR